MPNLQSHMNCHKPHTYSWFNNSLFLQVLHSRGNHWIVVSALGHTSSVKVYDSLYKAVDGETKRFRVKVFGPNQNILKSTREEMLRQFHTKRSSKDLFLLWAGLFTDAGIDGGPVFIQHITSHIFTKLAKTHPAPRVHRNTCR